MILTIGLNENSLLLAKNLEIVRYCSGFAYAQKKKNRRILNQLVQLYTFLTKTSNGHISATRKGYYKKPSFNDSHVWSWDVLVEDCSHI